jgi:hypothetical protein
MSWDNMITPRDEIRSAGDTVILCFDCLHDILATLFCFGSTMLDRLALNPLRVWSDTMYWRMEIVTVADKALLTW